MSAVDRDLLRKLEAAATPGPWVRGWYSGQAEGKCPCDRKGPLLAKVPQTQYPGDGPFHVHETDFFEDDHAITGPDLLEQVAGNYDYEQGGIVSRADADLIVALRNAAPELLASEPTLDAAWAEAEAALPEGWRLAIDPYYPTGWEAHAYDINEVPTSARSDHSTGACFGPTPAAALRALAAALRDSGVRS